MPNIIIMPAAQSAPPDQSNQPQRNRRRSARVPQSPAAGLEITLAWLQGSQETTLAESSRTMRANIETVLRNTLLQQFPELPGRIARMRQSKVAA